MTNPLSSYQAVCRPGTGAGAFFTSILVWGVGIGCFGAAFNNFLVETYDINGFDRGVLEFLRETPGVLLVAIFAALHRFSDWKVLRLGTACSLIAAVLLLVPVRWAWAVAFIVVWALGEHLVMPVRQSLALSIAKEGKSGESLGIVTGAINAGTVAGSVLVAAIHLLLRRARLGGRVASGALRRDVGARGVASRRQSRCRGVRERAGACATRPSLVLFPT